MSFLRLPSLVTTLQCLDFGRETRTERRNFLKSNFLNPDPIQIVEYEASFSVCPSPAACGVSLPALAPQVVGERELEQRGEDEGRAGAHPDVYRLQRDRGREGGKPKRETTCLSRSHAAESIWHV